MVEHIRIKGAREHNLKNITLTLPREKLIVFTGISGSGKSTLAFDTLYAEGQRRYVESLSAYARQFLGLMNKPDVDSIEGLSPAISIEQKTTSKNPRSTVGTVTEIYDYLRLLYARIGTPYCPEHHLPIKSQSPERIAEQIISQQPGGVTILAPVVRQKKGTYDTLVKDLGKEGYARVRINGKIQRTDEDVQLERYKKHDIDVVIDRIETRDESRLREAVEQALIVGKGNIIVESKDKEIRYSSKLSCPICGYSLEELQPRMFSFNSPFGACKECSGLGIKMEFDEDLIIPDKGLSIADGAIMIYRNAVDGWRGQYLAAVAKHAGFDIFTPISFLSEKNKKILLYGTHEKIKFKMHMKDSQWSHQGEWEGIIPQSERLYKQTQSDYRRRELEKFMRIHDCPVCHGKRLNEDVLNVKIQDISIIDVTKLSIQQAIHFFKTLNLTEKVTVIAKQVLQELNEGVSFVD